MYIHSLTAFTGIILCMFIHSLAAFTGIILCMYLPAQTQNDPFLDWVIIDLDDILYPI